MYQRRSNLQNLMILLLDCLTIVVSLILANYIRNGRLFESDDARMDFGLLLGAVLVVFLAMNLFGSLYRNMMLRGPLHECMCVIRNNAISFAGHGKRACVHLLHPHQDGRLFIRQVCKVNAQPAVPANSAEQHRR